MWHDLRFALRSLLARPAFTAVAASVLALGIGANTAIFSLVNAFLLKPLAIQRPNELMGCYSRDTKHPDRYRAFSYASYSALRGDSAVFSGLLAHNMAMVGVTEGGSTRRVFADIVSANYFATFGVAMFRGRAFTDAEERPGADLNSVILSYSYWQRHGADEAILGKALRINGRNFAVVGVAPAGFTGSTALVSPELFVPLGAYAEVINDFAGQMKSLADPANYALILIGRMRAGISQASAEAQLTNAAGIKDYTLLVRPLSRLSVSDQPQTDAELTAPAVMLLAMSGVVLLIASLNVANMVLARSAARRKEIAVRLAIGGGRWRIVRQLFAEGLILALMGSAGGLILASWSTSALVASLARLAPIDFIYSAAPDARVLAATLVFALGSTVLFSLAPAWKLSRPDLVSDLKRGPGADSAGSRRLFSRRNLLVMGQLSLSLMMLAAAGMFVRSAIAAANLAPGFAIDRTIVAELDTSLAGYDEARGRQTYAAVLERLRAVPGIESATLSATVPFGMTSFGRGLRPSNAPAEAKPVSAAYNIVSADYFRTMSIPLLRGRSFTAAERTHTVVIDRLAAERLWPGEDALGRHVRVNADDPSRPADDAEVVGIVGNVQEHILGRSQQPHAYVPFGANYQSNMYLQVRTSGGDIAGAIRRELTRVDANLPVLSLRGMREHLESSIDLWVVRMGAQMLAVFGCIALLLAIAGLYGVKAYAVAQRTREIGIRMALGADPAETRRLILREGLRVTLAGVGIGMLLAFGVGRLLASMLWDVRAADPLVFAAAPLVLTAVALIACYIPARRAARVDPMVALRYE
jgi:putative ABC transport system permease protein